MQHQHEQDQIYTASQIRQSKGDMAVLCAIGTFIDYPV